MKNRRFWTLLAVLPMLAACHEEKQQTLDAIPVKTLTVEAQVAEGGRQYVGVVEEASATVVSFTGTGTVKSLCVSEGQTVSKGQLIATLDDTQARNMLSASESAMHQAEDALARMKQLHDASALPDLKWVEVQSKVEQAKAQLEMARKNLAECSIHAPVSGIVGKRMMNVGETALPSQPVVTLLQIDPVKVRVSIPEKEIASLTAHTPTTIAIEALGGRTYQGGSVEKGVTADGLTHTYNIRIRVDNGDRQLLPGMVASVSLDNTSVEGACIMLPIRCIQQRTDGRHFVWTVREGKAHRTDVTLGEAVGNSMVISEGLQQGDKVITAGYHKVSEGKEVRE